MADLCYPKIHKFNSWPSVSQNVIVFGSRAFKEVIKVKWGYTDGL